MINFQHPTDPVWGRFRRTARRICALLGGILPLIPTISTASTARDLFIQELSTSPWPLALGALALVEAIVITKLLRDLKKLRAESDPAGAGAAGAAPHQSELAALYSKALTGSLDRFSIGEVIQFLNSIRETGILDIVDDRVSAVHRLLVEGGEIIDAYNGNKRGEDAVQQIMRCEEGSFTFIRGDLPSNERVIEKSTMTLLMECYQHKDESREVELNRP